MTKKLIDVPITTKPWVNPQLVFCKNCVMPSTRPRIEFDERGFCNACVWSEEKKNLVDWDRPSAKARFSADVIRMDNNEFPINFTLHPWSGAAYYSAARTNGISFGWSSVYAIGAMLAWEYGIEFREKVSFNDLIFTPLPGISLGEFFSRLALYVNRFPGKPSVTRRVLGVAQWALGRRA